MFSFENQIYEVIHIFLSSSYIFLITISTIIAFYIYACACNKSF